MSMTARSVSCESISRRASLRAIRHAKLTQWRVCSKPSPRLNAEPPQRLGDLRGLLEEPDGGDAGGSCFEAGGGIFRGDSPYCEHRDGDGGANFPKLSQPLRSAEGLL